MMCVGSAAVIWLVDYWVLYGQPWLMPTHPSDPPIRSQRSPIRDLRHVAQQNIRTIISDWQLIRKSLSFKSQHFVAALIFFFMKSFFGCPWGFTLFCTHTLASIVLMEEPKKYLLFVCFVLKEADLFERLGWSRVTCPMLQENTTWAAWIVKDWIWKFWTGSTH